MVHQRLRGADTAIYEKQVPAVVFSANFQNRSINLIPFQSHKTYLMVKGGKCWQHNQTDLILGKMNADV